MIILYIYIYVYSHLDMHEYCPISGYSEGLLSVDKRPTRVPLILLSQKLGRAPKGLLLAGDLCQLHQPLSLDCSQMVSHAAKSS